MEDVVLLVPWSLIVKWQLAFYVQVRHRWVERERRTMSNLWWWLRHNRLWQETMCVFIRFCTIWCTIISYSLHKSMKIALLCAYHCIVCISLICFSSVDSLGILHRCSLYTLQRWFCPCLTQFKLQNKYIMFYPWFQQAFFLCWSNCPTCPISTWFISCFFPLKYHTAVQTTQNCNCFGPLSVKRQKCSCFFFFYCVI